MYKHLHYSDNGVKSIKTQQLFSEGNIFVVKSYDKSLNFTSKKQVDA